MVFHLSGLLSSILLIDNTLLMENHDRRTSINWWTSDKACTDDRWTTTNTIKLTNFLNSIFLLHPHFLLSLPFFHSFGFVNCSIGPNAWRWNRERHTIAMVIRAFKLSGQFSAHLYGMGRSIGCRNRHVDGLAGQRYVSAADAFGAARYYEFTWKCDDKWCSRSKVFLLIFHSLIRNTIFKCGLELSMLCLSWWRFTDCESIFIFN